MAWRGTPGVGLAVLSRFGPLRRSAAHSRRFACANVGKRSGRRLGAARLPRGMEAGPTGIGIGIGLAFRYEMIYGRTPFRGHSLKETFDAIRDNVIYLAVVVRG